MWIWNIYDRVFCHPDLQRCTGCLTHCNKCSSHTDQTCLSRSQITNQWGSHISLWVFSCLPDSRSWQQQHKGRESWFWFWLRGWEALGGWEGKGRAVPGNTVREKSRFVFPGRTDCSCEPHSCPVIHMWCLSNWPEACLTGAKLLETNGAIWTKHYVFWQLCGDYLQQAYADEVQCKETNAHKQTFWVM